MKRDAVILFIAATLISLGISAMLPAYLTVENHFETLNAARTLASTGTIGNPFRPLPTGPTAHVAPVFPAVAALLLISGLPWQMCLTAFAGLMWGLNAALLPGLAELYFGDRIIGFYAGLLSAASLLIVPQEDVQLSAFLCIVACIFLLRESRIAPALCGLAALANPVCTLPILAMALRKGLKIAALAIAGMVLFCLPWMARNWFTLHVLAPGRDNFGLELHVSNNDCAQATFMQNLRSGCFQSVHPNESAAEAAEVARLGEGDYNRQKMREALHWIATHPTRFATLTAERVFYFLFPPFSPGIWLLTGFVLAGIALRWLPIFGNLQLAAVGAWLPYFFQQSDPRFRAVSLWIWVLLAGYVLRRLWILKHKRSTNAVASK